jgi:hypothetical protein
MSDFHVDVTSRAAISTALTDAEPMMKSEREFAGVPHS